MSLKEGERIWRTDPTICINIIDMARDTPIRHQPDKCWASQENKQNIQLLVRQSVGNGDFTILPSSPALLSRMMRCFQQKTTCGVIVSCETVQESCHTFQRYIHINFALLLHCALYLRTQGLKEIWQHYGTGEKRRVLHCNNQFLNLEQHSPYDPSVHCMVWFVCVVDVVRLS